jgi:hypothetical protein
LERLDHMSLAELEGVATAKESASSTPEQILLARVPGLKEKLVATYADRQDLNVTHMKLFNALKELIPGAKNEAGVVVDIDVGKAEGLAKSNNDPQTITGNAVRKTTLFMAGTNGGAAVTAHPREGTGLLPAGELANFVSLYVAAKYSTAVDNLSVKNQELAPLKAQVQAIKRDGGTVPADKQARIDELELEVEQNRKTKDRWNFWSDVSGVGGMIRAGAQSAVLFGAAHAMTGSTATAMTAAAYGTAAQAGLTLAWLAMQRNGKLIMPQRIKTVVRVSAFTSMVIVPSAVFVIKNFIAPDPREKSKKPIYESVWQKWGETLPERNANSSALPESQAIPLPGNSSGGMAQPIYAGPLSESWPGSLRIVADNQNRRTASLFGIAQEGLALDRVLSGEDLAQYDQTDVGGRAKANAALKALYQLNPQLDPALEDGRVTSDPRDPDRLINGMTVVNLGPQLNSAA